MNKNRMNKDRMNIDGIDIDGMNIDEKASSRERTLSAQGAGKTIGIIGLGLLGGSLAKALSAYTDYRVIGYARRQETCDAAMATGAAAEATTDSKRIFAEADVLFLALPPEENSRIFADCRHVLRPGTLVSDVASTKGAMMEKIYPLIPEGVSYVSVHPMAGSEKGGFERAAANLFTGCTWIVLRDEGHSCWNQADEDFLADLGRQVKGRIETIPLAEHDRLLAYISHLPHLMASVTATLAGGDEEGELRMRLGAGGFRDVTRVAGGNPSMWREIIYGNREEMLNALQAEAAEVAKLMEMLRQDDGGEALLHYLERAKTIRDRFGEIYENQ